MNYFICLQSLTPCFLVCLRWKFDEKSEYTLNFVIPIMILQPTLVVSLAFFPKSSSISNCDFKKSSNDFRRLTAVRSSILFSFVEIYWLRLFGLGGLQTRSLPWWYFSSLTSYLSNSIFIKQCLGRIGSCTPITCFFYNCEVALIQFSTAAHTRFPTKTIVNSSSNSILFWVVSQRCGGP